MRINIVGGSYQNKYSSVNTHRCINWYIHKDLIEGETAKYKTALLPFPGLTSFCDTTKTYLRKIFVARTLTYTRCFVVADNTLYELDSAGTKTSRGTLTDLTNDSTPVYMEVNSANQIMIAHSSASYIFDMSTNTLTKITDGDFPGSVTYLSYTTGYFFVCSGGRVYYSNLNDGLSWTATDVFTPIAAADNTLAVVIWKDELHCFGTETIEVYINDGTSPFSKQPRTTINIGLVSVDTLQTTEQGILFLGKSRKGQLEVYFYDGVTCNPISPLSTVWNINNIATVTSNPTYASNGDNWESVTTDYEDYTDYYDGTAIGTTSLVSWSPVTSPTSAYADIQYTKNGNVLYYLTIPSLHTTYVFDLMTKEWVERQSLNPNNSLQQEFRGKHMINFEGQNLITDLYSGVVYIEDYTSVTENGTAITRTLVSQIVSNEKKNISFYDFELETNAGIGLKATPNTEATFSLYISKDGGYTYGNAITLTTGASGEYLKRCRVNKLGTARDWVFKIVLTDQADVMIQEALVHGVVDTY
jgi:hypothetical protein